MAKIKVSSERFAEFVERGQVRAEKLDRREKLAPEIRITFEDPVDMMRALSPERVRVIHALRTASGKGSYYTLSSLAQRLKRDRASVHRDVALLEKYGLLRTRTEPNPGHGRVKIVETLAQTYELTTRF